MIREPFIRAVIGVLIVLALLVIALLYAVPVRAAACITVEQDRAMAERSGYVWLAIIPAPFTDGQLVFYTKAGVTYVSAVIEGCVDGRTYRIGPSIPREAA